MLRVGERQAAARSGSTIAIAMVQGDATRIPLADASVDAVTIGFGIRNVEHMDAACAEMHRVLKPGGRLAILEFAVPTMPVVRRALLLVPEPRAAAHRPRGLAPQRGVRLSAGVGRRVRVAG